MHDLICGSGTRGSHGRGRGCLFTPVAALVIALALQGVATAREVNGRGVPMTRSGLDQGGAKVRSLGDSAEVTSKESAPLASVGGGIAGVPANDLCANAALINTQGTFAWDNSMAAKDGPNNAACIDSSDPVGSIDKDIWYCWTAPCSGPVTIDTCGLTAVDTKVAVYDGCTCPVTNANLIDCNDDATECGLSSLESSVTFLATAGQPYMVRLGSYPGNTSIPAAPGGPGEMEITCVDLPCDQPANQCQPVNVDNAFTSNRTDFITADNFTPLVDGAITEVCWWGSYSNDIPFPNTFEIRYFDTINGFPGNVIAGPFQQSQGTLQVSGPEDTALGVDFPVFEYSATHAAVPVAAGDCYWVEISNATDGLSIWFWHWGDGGDIAARLDGDPLNGYGAGDTVDSDVAFCVNLPTGDASSCPPELLPQCASAVGDCCAENGSAGCDDPSCCSKVCACDSFCCTVAWDFNCAGAGAVPGCGAALLCEEICAGCPAGPVTFIDPPNGVVDAGQPSALNDANALLGISSLKLSAPAGADNPACWSLCETAAHGAPNAVIGVTTNMDGTLTVTLARPITPGAKTTVTYTDDSAVMQTGTLLAHPANSNADASATAQDILALINCCLNQVCTPPFGIYSCDANRDGNRTAQDITRLIDLLNGAAAFDPWVNTPRPSGACP